MRRLITGVVRGVCPELFASTVVQSAFIEEVPGEFHLQRKAAAAKVSEATGMR